MASLMEGVQNSSAYAGDSEPGSTTGLRETHREADLAVAFGMGLDRQN